MSEIDIFNNSNIPSLTYRQKNIVLGCLLGRSSIIKPPGNRSCYFYIRQSKKEDINILAYKVAELKEFGRPKAIIEDKNSIKWYSSTNPEWDNLYQSCYKDGRKKLTDNWLNSLTSSSFAMMFFDLARLGKDMCLNLEISSFYDDKNLLIQYFEEVGLPCYLKNKRLDFDRTATNKFLQIIYQDVPEYLLYRIHRYMP